MSFSVLSIYRGGGTPQTPSIIISFESLGVKNVPKCSIWNSKIYSDIDSCSELYSTSKCGKFSDKHNLCFKLGGAPSAAISFVKQKYFQVYFNSSSVAVLTAAKRNLVKYNF